MIAVPTTESMAPRQIAAARLPVLPHGVRGLFSLVTGLFFLWGIPNSMNDVLIRQFMKSFSISRFEAGLVQSAFYFGYFALALPAGLLMKRRGYKAGLVAGLLLFATGCLLFLPAANAGKYGYFLAALFIVSSGLAFLETASNPLIAQLGPTATSEQRLNLAQAFNPVGYFLGVLVGTLFIFSGVELTPHEIAVQKAAGIYAAYMHTETLRVVAPYLVLGVLALIWAVVIGLTKFPAFLREREHVAETSGDWRELFSKRHFVCAVLAQFCYCGSQTGAWSYFIQYAKEYGGVTEKRGGVLLACTIAGFGLGRFVSTALMRRFSATRIMGFYAVGNALLLSVVMAYPGWLGIGCIMATGMLFSLMFPTIFALGIKDLGPNTNIAGSLIVMAIVGGAVFTPTMGWLAEKLHSTASSYVLPVLGCLCIAAYSFAMTRYRSERLFTSTFEI